MIASDAAIFSIDKIILNAKLLIETRWPNWSNDKPQWRKLYRKKKENLQRNLQWNTPLTVQNTKRVQAIV